jgi:hypothetical protein
MNNSKKYAQLIYKPKGDKREIGILYDYKGIGFLKYNNFLRDSINSISLYELNNIKIEKNKPIPLSILLNHFYNNLVKEIKLLDNLFLKNRKLKNNLIVYRGIKIENNIKDVLSNFEKNKIWLEKGFMSTSISSQFSYLFSKNFSSDNEMFLLKIKVPKGTPYIPLAWNVNKPNKEYIKRSEYEILLPRNCTLIFDKKEIKEYSFKITFENVLKDRKYKVLTYKCHLEYNKNKNQNLPDEDTFLSNTKFEVIDEDFSKILISHTTTSTTS